MIYCIEHFPIQNIWIISENNDSDTNLQHCIKKVVDHAKKTIALPQNTQTIKEI